MADNDILVLTGLWKNTDKNNEMYLAGNLGNLRILVFKNKKKQGEKDPDYRICVAKKQERAGRSPDGQPPDDESIAF